MLGSFMEPHTIITIFGMVLQNLCLKKCDKNIIPFATILARRHVLLKWKERSPPTFNLWVKDLICHLTHKKIQKISFWIR